MEATVSVSIFSSDHSNVSESPEQAISHSIGPGGITISSAPTSMISRFSFLLLVLIFTVSRSFGQTYPIDANTILIPPYSLDLSSYQVEKSQDLMLSLTLNDPTEPFWDVRLRMTVSNNGTEILQTSPGFVPGPIRLNQFATVTFTGFELSEYFAFENLTGINGYTYDGTLPEGLNSICFEVLDYNRQEIVLSRQACGSGYAVLNDPPFPQLPICGEDITFQEAQNITFNWMPMHLGSPNPVRNFEYEFTLVRVEEGYNEFEAMESAFPIHQETTTNTTIILQDPILEGGYTYAWRIQVVDAFTGEPLTLFKNEGYSIVCTFNYKAQGDVDLSEFYADYEATECAASCQAEVPTNSEIVTDLGIGDVVQIGKFYMNITSITSSNGGFYGGKGYIFIPFLLSNMNVTFEDMTVNTDGVVYSGDIVTDIDSESLTDNFSDTDGDMTIDADAIAAINEEVENDGRQVNQMENGSSLGLPIALDNTIGGVTNNLIITGISFDTDIAYLNAVMSFGSSAGGDLIAFGAKGICFHPYGIGGGESQLFLNEDFSLSSAGLDLTFLAPGNGNDGTFVTFDCSGFQELNIEAEYEFPGDMLARADGSGEPVVASVNINTTEWGQFIADVSFDEFEVVGVDGYAFSIDEAYLDFSDAANPDDIAFPDDYDDTGDDWVGFYLASSTVTFPEDMAQPTGDLSLGVRDVIIDNSGVSANIFAAGLLDIDNGRLGEWAFSVDTVQIDIVSNALVEGSLLGQIHVPIMDEENALNYSALMSKTADGLDLLFTINTEEDVSVSMWAADLTLSNASVIAIEKTSDGLTPYAELHGDITLDVEIQEGNSFEVEALSFEGLKINHPDESQRLAVEAFSLFGGGAGFGDEDEGVGDSEGEDSQETLSGFPVSFSNVAFVEGDGSEAGINFDLSLNLTGDDLGVAATGNITVTGEYDAAGAPFNAWSFQGVELSSLDVNADLAAGSIEGSLNIYKGDATFGSGFKGLLSANFTGVGKVDALAQFGKVSGFRYFFVDAMLLSQSPFVDILGVGLYGFGGGMYHHMSRDDADPAMNLEAGTLYAEPSELGASLSGIRYTPDKSTLLGLKAALTMGIAPGTSFSADASIEASFGLNNSVPSLRSIGIGGKAYFMSPGSILERDDSQVIGQFDANLDLSDPEDPVFTGTAQVTFDTNVITGNGNAAMKLSKEESYIWIGTPSNPVSIGVKNFGTFQLYADMGDKVPAMPSIRSLVPNYRGSTPTSQRPADLGGTKIVFGAKFGIDKQSYSYGSFYASAQFGLGFDAYLSQVSAADCGIASGNIGIDNWYLSGQAYAYGSGNVGIKVNTFFYKGNINILDLSASVVMQAQLPNPTWLKGEVAIDYSVLSGAVKGSVDYSFEVGERCQFTTNAMAGVEVIADISPKSNARNVSCLASPTVAFNFGINQIIEVGELDEDGDKTTYQYRPVISSFTMNNGASYVRKVASDGVTASLTLASLLKGQSSYDCYIAVKWEKRKKGRRSWTELDGVEEKSFTFRTGDPPEYIPTDAVAWARPFVDGRNIYDRDQNASFDVFLKQTGWSYLFDDPDNYDYQLKIEDLTNGGSKTMDITYTETKFVSFLPYKYARISGAQRSWNTWVNGRDGNIFKCTVMGVYKNASTTSTTTSSSDEDTGGADGNVSVRDRSISGVNTADAEDKTIYVWHFRKSDYNTPLAKMRDYKFGDAASYDESYEGYSTRRHEVMGYFESSDEMLDKVDYEGISTTISGLDFTMPATFTFSIVDYNSSKSSKIKSIMDRHDAIYKISDNIRDCKCKSYFKSSWTRNRSRFSGYIGDKMSWDMNDVWGTGKGWNRMARSYNRDYLTSSEKSSGQAGLGVSRTSRQYNGVRFWTRAERWVTHEHKDMRTHGYNNTKKGFRYDHEDYIWMSWNASGRMTDSRWKVKLYNPETGARGMVTVDPK